MKKIITIFLLIILINSACTKKEDPQESLAKLENGDNVSSLTQPMENKKYQTYSLGQNRNAKVMVFEDKYLWLGTSSGLLRFDTTTYNKIDVYNTDNGLLSNGIFSITMDKQGNKWIGTYGGGLSKFDGKSWKNYNVPHGLCDSFVYDVLFQEDSMWVATWSGANRIRGDIEKRSSWEKFTVENTKKQLGDNWVYALDVDRKGNIWFGTEIGISLFTGKAWSKWDHNQGMGAAADIVQEANARMNAALEGSHHAGQQAQAGLLKRNIGNYNPNYVVSMIMDKNDNLWIGTWGGGLARFDGQNFKNYTVRDGLPGNYIIGLNIDPKGNVWVGTNSGLSMFDGNGFKNYSTKDGLFSDYVFSIAFDAKGDLWAGGWNGFSHILLN